MEKSLEQKAAGLLVLIAFAAVPIFIEYLLKNALDLLLGEGMLSAMLMSIAMAAVLF